MIGSKLRSLSNHSFEFSLFFANTFILDRKIMGSDVKNQPSTTSLSKHVNSLTNEIRAAVDLAESKLLDENFALRKMLKCFEQRTQKMELQLVELSTAQSEVKYRTVCREYSNLSLINLSFLRLTCEQTG